MKLKLMLPFIGALFILFAGCKKNDNPGPHCDQFANGINSINSNASFSRLYFCAFRANRCSSKSTCRYFWGQYYVY